jgi:hypothetical protein
MKISFYVALFSGFPSINRNEQSALARANATPINIIIRKLVTKDTEIAFCTAAEVALLTPAGISMPTSLFYCATSTLRTPGGRASAFRLLSRLALNVARATIPGAAIASKPAVRAIALLMPDAIPARWESTDPITAVVNGTTSTHLPAGFVRGRTSFPDCDID